MYIYDWKALQWLTCNFQAECVINAAPGALEPRNISCFMFMRVTGVGDSMICVMMNGVRDGGMMAQQGNRRIVGSLAEPTSMARILWCCNCLTNIKLSTMNCSNVCGPC